MSLRKGLLVVASLSIAAPLSAQQQSALPDASAVGSGVEPTRQKVVEGDTPDRVAQVERCQGHKFESRVEIDAITKRSTRIKLCANPGASDAEWVKTLQAAVVQIERRDMPPEARQQLIGELRGEITKYAATTAATAPPAQGAAAFITNLDPAAPPSGTTERFETSVLPPLPAPKSDRTNSPARNATAAIASNPQAPMRIGLKCLERGQTGPGATCNLFLESSTTLVVRAVEGLEDGGTLRFRRRGDVRGEVALPRMPAGQSTRVRLPGDLCRGVASTKVEIELLGPKSAGVSAARFGPYNLRC